MLNNLCVSGVFSPFYLSGKWLSQPFDERNPAFEFVHYANTDNAIDRPENYYRQFSNGEVLITVYDDNNDDLEILITYYDKLDRQNVTETFDELAQDSKILGLLNDKQIRLVRKNSNAGLRSSNGCADL